MASQRPLIIPWLIGKINSQMYPGVRWVNDEKTQFRLPWKHFRRQDLSEDDMKIFEDWAIDSGCYDPKIHKPEPARWKRNFRSALNQKDSIHMVGDYSSDSVDPHKIFEITRGDTAVVSCDPCSGTGSRQPHQHLGISSHPAASQQIYMIQRLDQLQLHQDNEALYCELENLDSPFVIPDVPALVQEIDPHISSSQLPTQGVDAYYEGAYAVGNDVPPGMTSEIQPGQVQMAQEQETFQQQILSHFTYNSFETDFEVNIYYRGTRVKSTIVSNKYGFCLTSRQQPPPGSYLEDVILPQAEGIVADRLLVQAVNCILPRLDQGTLVEVRNGVICGKRLGNCRSFWTITDTPNNVLPSPIEKNDYCVLYTLQQFVTELIEFVERRRKESPQYTIWICLGETWPDGKPWRTKCIMVEIIPVVMRLLHELSYKTGASSLSQSDLNLEISDSASSPSSVLSLLKSIEERMDWG